MPPQLPPGEVSTTPAPPPVAPQSTFVPPLPKPRTAQQQSWSTIISILIIMLMIITGAFYAWGKKLAEQRALLQQLNATTTAP